MSEYRASIVVPDVSPEGQAVVDKWNEAIAAFNLFFDTPRDENGPDAHIVMVPIQAAACCLAPMTVTFNNSSDVIEKFQTTLTEAAAICAEANRKAMQ